MAAPTPACFSPRANRLARALTKAMGPLPADPLAAAGAVGLRYVSDDSPGIRRRRQREGFAYFAPNDHKIRDRETLARIRALAIPPAWKDVWICPRANGHLQATGKDARGRKQYRYHPHWREVRDSTKYDKLLALSQVLPALRRRVARDLAQPGMGRDKVLAAIVRLLESTYIRIGNDEYARTNGSYGLTTLRNHHAQVRGQRIRFHFRGKSGIEHQVDLEDPRLARIVRACQDLPGQDLFGYVDDDGTVRDVGSSDVNDYLREVTGQEFTAKDFRTWAGTVLATSILRRLPPPGSATEAKRQLVAAVKCVAQSLRNTQAVCRKCYIHPAVITAYSEGLFPNLDVHRRRGLSLDESVTVTLLRRHRPALAATQKRRRVRAAG